MILKILPYELTLCKVLSPVEINLFADFFFIGKTDEELSLVCITSDVPMHTTDRHDGWRGFRIEGEVDDQVCEVSSLSSALIGSHIDILSVSTFNTDYILVRGDELSRAVAVLEDKGYMVQ